MRAIPRSIFSWDFDVVENGRTLCVIDQGFWGERASFQMEGRTYTLGRESGWGDFWVREGGAEGRIIVRATKTSVFRRRFDVVIDGVEFVLEPYSWFGWHYNLVGGGKAVGSIRRASFFRRGLVVDLPEQLPVAARVFLLWLVLMMTRRAQRNSS